MADAAAPRLGCLIMAAGNASRFGANKLFAAYRGKTFLELALLAVPPQLFARVTVVSQYEPALGLARQYGFEAIRNCEPELGVSRTIQLGTQAMLDCDAILYMVADQPLLQPNSVCAVAERWLREPDTICGAAHNGVRGNPCIFPKAFFPELLALTGDTGGSRVIRRGDILPAAALDNMKLRPVCLGNADCELVYCPIENGTLTDAVTVSLRILSGTNTAPVCEDGTLETYKNIANSGVLAAVDQEDQQLTYQLVKEPKRGTVELHEDGSFTYTPDKNKVGKDSFIYTATDPAGNVSNEACIKIRILKPADKATYQDMSGDRDAFAAMWLKDKGLYTGRIIAGNLCFEPDASVSRSEFLIACMKLAGLEQSDEAISTGFADELDTPRWQQPYLAAAYQSGMISGTPTEEGLVFRPEEDLSRAEAAVMLQKLLRLPGDAAVFAPDEASAIPAWAQSAVSALSNAGIPLAASDYEAPLTRREAANMLLAAAPAAKAAGLYWAE